MGHLFIWIGFTLLAYAAYNLQKKAIINAKLRERKTRELLESDYIERKGL